VWGGGVALFMCVYVRRVRYVDADNAARRRMADATECVQLWVLFD
jgi:hypothetical protein